MNKPKNQTINGKYFKWKIFEVNNVYYADGRSNPKNARKHSLGTKDREEALRNLHTLDEAMAIELGLATPPPASQVPDEDKQVSITDGWSQYFEHCGRPRELGGVSEGTLKRYRAVRDKHIKFCHSNGIQTWNDFQKKQAESYGTYLDENKKSPRTIIFELNTLLSVNKWLVAEQQIPTSDRLQIKVVKPEGTDAHCWTQTQVKRMLEFCATAKHGAWFRPILVTLATTGLRVGELIALRWEDIDFNANLIRIMDERYSGKKNKMKSARKVKGKRGRVIPIHPSLRETLGQLERHPDGGVFHGPKGGTLQAKTVLDIFKRNIRNKLKEEFPTNEGQVGFADGTIHSFRHYFVSEAFRQGATEAEVMDWVGHRESKMVHHYRHLRPDDSQSRMRKIDFLADDTGSSAD